MRREILVRVGAFLLVIAACSGDDAAPVTTSGVATTAPPATTTTASPSTTATTPPETTTTEPAGDTVGDPAALEALVEEVTQQVRIVYADDSIEVPVPDLTNPDPVVAAQAINEFDQLVAADVPFRDWLSVTAYEGSPAFAIGVENFDRLLFGNLVRVRPEAGYEFHGGEVLDFDVSSLPIELVEGMPTDAVGVLYSSSSGPLHLVDRDTGDTVEVLTDGWANMPVLKIVVATAGGWREWGTVLDFGGTA